ncbi:MAG: pantoate kinase [Methanomassiliicoccus sp.]|nr:pantoate kinase [Methanomassiliicoccus sp.]
MKATAFCPGHITGFFQPCEHEEPLLTGSRGAGLCVNRGVTTSVTSRPGTGRIEISIDGRRQDAEVTRSAAALLLGDELLDITVDSFLDLPGGAGFGMSAAGALSTTFALAEILERPPEDAFAAAHLAELKHRTGLGDVAALTRGGMTFRRREGLPPYGQVDRLDFTGEIVAAVVGDNMRTADVLNEAARRGEIVEAGRACSRELSMDPTAQSFFRLSREFTDRCGLAGAGVREALDAVKGLGQASMIMLGNSVFACGDLDAIQERWAFFGPTFRLSIDYIGPRVLVHQV